jgi:hypothetical protein
MRAKRPVRGGMKVRAYPVLCQAVEKGVAYGWRRAHKHNDAPDPETIEEQIVEAVLSEVCDYFDFDEHADV